MGWRLRDHPCQASLFAASVHPDDRFREVCGLPHTRQQDLQPPEFWMEHFHPDDRQRMLDLRQELHEGRLTRLSVEF